MMRARSIQRAALALGVAASLAIDTPAWSAPFKVYSPKVERGVNELEYRMYRDFDHRDEIDGSQAHKLSVGRGVTDFWFTEVYASFEKEDGASLKQDAVEWENKFQLTPRGKYWLDLGLLAELEMGTRSGSANEFVLGPLLEKELGPRWLATVNLLFEREFGANAESGTTFAYAGRLKLRLNQYFDPAIEVYGKPGRIGHFGSFSRQEHWAGPAFYGKVKLENAGAFEYSAALLFGTSEAASDRRAVLRLEYEF
ncbi:MAG: hypothetical protein IT515_03250 [Burkholderiales bacterium]|nr:hypothetical protein [Burkholderiales bacterium]